MKERPMLMNGAMVRAVLSGAKTQTRRPLSAARGTTIFGPKVKVAFGHRQEWADLASDEGRAKALAWCPFGVRGDRLWVRETHAFIWPGESPPDDVRDCRVEYRADTGAKHPGEWPDDSKDPACPHWKPSLHMPRWASRLTLEITDVRVDRLQDINHDDAQAECVDHSWSTGWDGKPAIMASAVDNYEVLWDSLYGKTAPWSSNPWVWTLVFRCAPTAVSRG